MSLPVLDLLPELRAVLAVHPLVVLQAPPGAGKSTALPLELLAEPWLAGGKILMLQPRRLAARAVAARLAEGLGEPLGQTVGYRVRFESAVGPATRLEVLTEGILTRRLQHDPELRGVGLVIFDEFHERSLHADLALALCREVQEALRPDLRVLIMSATLDPALPERLGGVPLLQSEGRSFPVELRYLPSDPTGDLAPALAARVSVALAEGPGDVLAFLPGGAEIRRAAALLAARHPEVLILPLYGDLPAPEQRRALLPDPAGRRKVVLATSIAETSLTIEGVRVVVDGGLARVPRSDPASGLSRLVTERVTRDAATQRAGRAGRLGPGVAYRLWSERTQAALRERRPPEILEADLAPTLLEVAQWGADPLALPWLDPPPARALAEARDLLTRLEALDAGGRLTARGAAMLELPTHPRLAHLLSEAAARGEGALAADVAALLEERDPLGRAAGTDLTDRVQALRAFRAGRPGAGERAAFERVERLSRQWRTRLKVRPDDTPPDPYAVGALVALAYPERVAQRREGQRAEGQAGRYRLAVGRGVRLPEGDALAGSPFLAVAQLDDAGADGRVDLAAPLDPAALRPQAAWTDSLTWDERSGSLRALSELRFGELVLESRPLAEVAPGARARAVAGAVRRAGAHLLPFTPAARQWQARVLSLRAWRPDEDWPEVSDAALLEGLEDWLGAQLSGVRTRDDLTRLDLPPALAGLLPWPLPARLDELAPTHMSVPSGSRVRLDYQPDGAAPVLAVKLQELFGLADTPRVNGGRTPVLLHLLSPAGRPVQVTQDLRSFWDTGYFEARKDLRGRYPRHPWPDDPWTAEATRRAKPRGT